MNNTPVISALNSVLSQSLVTINQYFLHARMVKNWGIEELNDKFYHQSILEMKLSDKLIERVFLLNGLPNLQDLGKLYIGEDVAEILECDLKLEKQKTQVIKDAIVICEREQDYVSRELLVGLKDESEDHIDWLESNMELMERIGIERYIQSHLD